MSKLRAKIAMVVQVLAHVKEKLHFISVQTEIWKKWFNEKIGEDSFAEGDAEPGGRAGDGEARPVAGS